MKNIAEVKSIIGEELELLDLVYKLEDLGYKYFFEDDNLHSLILENEKLTVCNNNEKLNILFKVSKFQTDEKQAIVKVIGVERC